MAGLNDWQAGWMVCGASGVSNGGFSTPGSQDVTRGRVKTLDWRPREVEKDLSGEVPEWPGGRKR